LAQFFEINASERFIFFAAYPGEDESMTVPITLEIDDVLLTAAQRDRINNKRHINNYEVIKNGEGN